VTQRAINMFKCPGARQMSYS